MNEIPRYKASMPLQKQFVTNADGCGDHVFTQLERSGNFAVYSRKNVKTDKVVWFEVVTIKTVKAGTVFAKGSAPTEFDYESYPGKSSFGRTAWAPATESAAWKRFDNLLLGKA